MTNIDVVIEVIRNLKTEIIKRINKRLLVIWE